MSDQFEGPPTPDEQYAPLAQWLYNLLKMTPLTPSVEPRPSGEELGLADLAYHLAFYPQIPNFALALLKGDPTATTQYAPLLFHLIGCPSCHRAYLETYDALRAALGEKSRAVTSALRMPSSLATTSPKLLVFLCQILIEQARAVFRQTRRDRSDQDLWARSLLQQAMQISRHIMQGTLRQRALRELVEVASLATPPDTDLAPGLAAFSYSALVGSGSGSRGKTVRRADMLSRAEGQGKIELRAGSLEGSVTQEDDLLILQLVDLDESLRGKMLIISVPLGTLLEPIRWLGGNPYAIRSSGPVGVDGTLTTPLGRTELLLSNSEDRNLVETLFKRLTIHPTA